MKNRTIQVQTKDLLNTLKKVMKGNNKKPSYKDISYPNYVRMRQGKKLVLSNIDSILTVSTSINIYGFDTRYDNINVIIDGVDKLISGLKYFTTETIITCDDDKKQVMFTDDKKVVVVNIIDNVDIPEIYANDCLSSSTEINFDLISILKKHIPFVSKSDTRPILTGVGFKDNKIVTTDSYRLSYSNIPAELPEMIVPMNCVKLMCENKEIIKKISINDNNKYVIFTCENATYLCNLIDGIYPNTDRLIPTDFNKEVTFKTDELLSNTNFMKAVCNKGDKALFNIVNNEIFGTSYKNNVNSDKLCECKTEPDTDLEGVTIAFNCDFLIDILKQINTNTIKLKYIGEMKPFVIDDNTETNYLILPVRTYK